MKVFLKILLYFWPMFWLVFSVQPSMIIAWVLYVILVASSTEKKLHLPWLFLLINAVLVFFAQSFSDEFERLVLVLDQFTVALAFGAYRMTLFPQDNRFAYAAFLISFLNLLLLPFDISPFEISYGMSKLALQLSLAASLFFMIVMIYLRFKQEQKNLQVIADKSKEVDWLSMLINLISHNVRTPIASVQSNLDLIEMKSKPNELEIQGEIDRMRTGIEDATSIMDRLLRAASLSSTVKVERNGRVLERFKQSYPEVVFEGEMDPLIVDSQQIGLQLALEVFIDNAIRHGGEVIKVSFSMEEVVIYDNGSGLTEAELSDFGLESTNNLSQRKVHGVGVHFALRMLESIGWTATPSNLDPGFQIVLRREA